MATYDYVTVDVFTDRRFGGNPLAVFPAADGLDTGQMQALAAEMNYSETTFVLPPDDPTNLARVRIFNRTAEMPFAGHPNVGTGFVLAQLGMSGGTLRFEELAGLVEVRLIEEQGSVVGAEIDAPQPLSLFEEFAVDGIAACVSLSTAQLRVSAHRPIRASVGVDFVFVETTAEALGSASPDLAAFRRLCATPADGERLSIFLYAIDGSDVRARMFAPLSGTWEDPATGSANATLAALRLHLSGAETLILNAVQGVEMGRESHLSLRSWRTADGIRASVGGRCVPVFRGSVTL